MRRIFCGNILAIVSINVYFKNFFSDVHCIHQNMQSFVMSITTFSKQSRISVTTALVSPQKHPLQLTQTTGRPWQLLTPEDSLLGTRGFVRYDWSIGTRCKVGENLNEKYSFSDSLYYHYFSMEYKDRKSLSLTLHYCLPCQYF